MTIETLPGYIKVETPEQAKPLPYTRFEVIGQGISGGFNETSYSYLSDISQRISTKYGGLDENSITEEEFRKIPGITDDMQYYAGMTYDVANRFIETRAARQEFELARENTNFATTGYYLAGGVVGNIPDFVNFLPFGLPRKGATLLANAARAAGANAAIEIALTPAAAYAYKNRGEEYTASDFWFNLAFAAGAGAGISAIGTGVRGLAGIAETYGLMAYPKDPVEVAAIRAKAASGEYAITPSFARLMQAEQIRYSQQSGVSIRNTDPFPTELGTKKYIDTTGQIHGTTESVRTNDFVVVGIDPNNRKVLSGSNESILKILPNIKRYLKDGEELIIKRNDLPGRDVSVSSKTTTTKQKKKLIGIDDYVTENEFKINNKLISQFLPATSQGADIAGKIKKLFVQPFVAQLDDNVAFTSKNVGNFRYEGEFEIKGEKRGFDPENGIGKIYEIDNATGQRRLLDNKEAKQVLNVLGEMADNRNTSNIDLIRKTDPEQEMIDSNPLARRSSIKGMEHANDPKKTNEVGNEPKIKTDEEIQQERARKTVVDPELKKTHGDFLTEAAVIGNLEVFNKRYGIRFNTETRKWEISDQNVYDYLNDVDKKNADKMLAMQVDQLRTDKDIIAQGMETRKDCA